MLNNTEKNSIKLWHKFQNPFNYKNIEQENTYQLEVQEDQTELQ